MIKPLFHANDRLIGLIKSHIQTIRDYEANDDYVVDGELTSHYIRGLERAVQIIEETTPRVIWKGDAE